MPSLFADAEALTNIIVNKAWKTVKVSCEIGQGKCHTTVKNMRIIFFSAIDLLASNCRLLKGLLLHNHFQNHAVAGFSFLIKMYFSSLVENFTQSNNINTGKAIIFSQCSVISLLIKQVGYFLSLLKGSSILKFYTFTWLYEKNCGREWGVRDFRMTRENAPTRPWQNLIGTFSLTLKLRAKRQLTGG